MYYILENGIQLKKWASGRACCGTGEALNPFPLSPKEYALLKSCDGMTDLPEDSGLSAWEAMGVVRHCRKGEARLAEGQIREYPNKLSCIIDWTITDRCNCNCLHCFHAADNTTQRNEFSREEAFRFLEEAEGCGVSDIRLTGGEPTLLPCFREVVEEIRNRGMRLETLITNGALLDEELAAFIRELHPNAQIMLSFDGIGFHDWLRQHKGSEESVMRAIRVSKAAGFKVWINMNVNRRNRSVIFDSVRLLADMGVDRLRIIRTTEAPRWQINAADASMTWEEYYDFTVDFIRWYRSSGITMTTSLWQSVVLRGKDQAYNIQPAKASRCTFCGRDPLCDSMLKKLSVQANGEIIPCAPLAGLFASRGIHMGNVKQDGLQKLLSEGSLFEMVTIPVKEKQLHSPQCTGCRYFTYCQGGCPALGTFFHGSPLGADETKCTFFKKGYYRKYSEALSGWKNLLPLAEEEIKILSETTDP